MKSDHGRFGFYFEKAGRGAAQGAIHPAAQFFEGSNPEVSLARETGQNALDAVEGDGPVKMIFDLKLIDRSEIPGIDDLIDHFHGAAESTKGKQGHEKMLRAVEVSSEAAIPVLRIGDYGTKGLHGSESVDHYDSPLSALTRGAGISANDGIRGGSFGIGSAVGPMVSDLSTVFYTSLPSVPDNSEVVFAGYSQLASHTDSLGVWRVADGFYTEIEREDFKYLRNPVPFGPFPERLEPGTDIYIPAYRLAKSDPELHKIRDAFILNFMAAIDRGKLVVIGRTKNEEWVLDSSTLEEYSRAIPEAQAFYTALKDKNPVSVIHKELGELFLYVNVDDGLERTFNTITMRRPLMRIESYRHNSISAKYAAILECSSKEGNSKLRELEPPEHTRWDPGRSPSGKKYIKYIKEFIREGLKSRIKEQIGEQVEIKGLEKYLPSQVIGEKRDRGEVGVPKVGGGVGEESATIQGEETDKKEIKVNDKRPSSVSIKVKASGGGGEQIEKGKDKGGDGKRKTNKKGIPGKGERGKGGSRISADDLSFRSWQASARLIEILITSSCDETGDIEMAPLGPGGHVEDGYSLPISSVKMKTDKGDVDLKWTGNVVHGVPVSAGERIKLQVYLSCDKRYRLGVK